ncbi:MAG: hypothetical protein ACTSYC_04690 [Promethearchaeota archaeon]
MESREKRPFSGFKVINRGIKVIIEFLKRHERPLLALTFVMGIGLSYPTVLPFGLVCSTLLLFHENKKANIAGVLLVIIQLLSLYAIISAFLS